MTSTPAPVVAAFDLDGTLTRGGSVFKWLRFVAGTGPAYRAAFTFAIPLLIGAIRSGRWADHAKEQLFQALLRGRDESDVLERSRQFIVRHLDEHGRSDVVERLRWHQRQGHQVVVVSASPQLYVDVVVERFEVEGGLGTRLAVDARGALTGSYLGQNCRGGEKLRRLEAWIGDRFPDVTVTTYGYGNSRGDRRLLQSVTYPFDVGRLGRLGALRHFPRLPVGDLITAGE